MSRSLTRIVTLIATSAAVAGLISACGKSDEQNTSFKKHDRDFTNTFGTSKPATHTANGSRSVEVTDDMKLIYRNVKNPQCMITVYGEVNQVVMGKDEFAVRFNYSRIKITPSTVACPETSAPNGSECVKNFAECAQVEQVLRDYLNRRIEAKLPLVNKSAETLLALAPLGS